MLQKFLATSLKIRPPDIDTIDNTLGDAMRMLANTSSQIIGSIILIAIALPYFLIPVAVISVAYYWMALFYRSSARELKVLIYTAHALRDSNVFAAFGRHSPKLIVFSLL